MSIWYYDGEEFTDTNATTSHHMLLYNLSNEFTIKNRIVETPDLVQLSRSHFSALKWLNSGITWKVKKQQNFI